MQTAELVSKQIKYRGKIQTDNDLIENDGGLLTVGKTTDEMKKEPFYKEFFDEMNKYYSMDIIEQNQEEEMPKIFMSKYNVESIENRKKRAKKIIKLINKLDEERIILVSHNGFIDILNQVILNTNDHIKGDLKNGKNCHLTYYQINERNIWKLICAPNTLHLA
jgi:broad specificity phosphatase PhoE